MIKFIKGCLFATGRRAGFTMQGEGRGIFPLQQYNQKNVIIKKDKVI